MSARRNYKTDLVLAWMIRVSFFVSITALVVMVMTEAQLDRLMKILSFFITANR